MALVIRAKRAPAGRETFEMAEEAKAPSARLTCMREVISGAAQKGILSSPSGDFDVLRQSFLMDCVLTAQKELDTN